MKPTKMNRHGKVLKGWKHKPAKPIVEADPDASLVKVPKLPAPKVAKVKGKAPPPPIPPSLLSRTPPPIDEVVATEKAALAARPKVGHPQPEPGDTHMEWRSLDGRVSVVCASKGYGDFSSLPGTVRYGRLRYGEDFIPDPRYEKQPAAEALLPGTEVAEGTQAPKPPRAKTVGGKREGVCEFIDKLIMEGGRTAQQVCDLTMKQFPTRDAAATLSTVKVRPSHIKRKGGVPPAFAK